MRLGELRPVRCVEPRLAEALPGSAQGGAAAARGVRRAEAPVPTGSRPILLGVADVAVISVVSSGVVGVLGAATAMYGQRMTSVTEREKRLEARRDDLRSVIDGAAEAAMAFVREMLAGDERTLGVMAQRIEGSLPELARHQARVGVRVGTESDVYTSYDKLASAIDDLRGTLFRSPLATMTLAEANRQPGDALEEAASAMDKVDEANDAFLDASSKEIGVR